MAGAKRTAIHAGHVIAFDGRGHRLLRDGVVVLEGDRIVHVGPALRRASVDETVDARDRVLTPGLISTHAHIAGSPLDRSFIEDRGSPQFWYSGLFEMLPVRERRPGRGGQPRLRRLLDGRAAPGRRDHRDGDRRARRARGRARARTSASASTWARPSAPGAGSPRTAGASSGSGTRSRAAQGLRARVDVPRALRRRARRPGALLRLARPRSTPARRSCCRPAKRFADEARRPVPGPHLPVGGRVQRDAGPPRQDADRLDARAGRPRRQHRSSATPSSSAAPRGPTIRPATSGIMADAGCSVAHAVWVFARRGVADGVVRPLPRRPASTCRSAPTPIPRA